MRNTENLNLALYDTSDKMNITGTENSLNHNMEILDQRLHAMDVQIAANEGAIAANIKRSASLEDLNKFAWAICDKSYVTLVFDDGSNDLGLAYEIAQEYGLTISCAIPPERLTLPLSGSTMTGTVKDACDAIVASGGEVLVHTLSPLNSEGATEQDFYNYFVQNKIDLEKAGYEINGIMTAGSGYSDRSVTLKWVRQYYLYSDAEGKGQGYPQYEKSRYSVYDNTEQSDIDVINTTLENAVKYKKWIVLAFHTISENSYFGTREASLRELFSKIKSYIDSGKLESVTYNYMYNHFGSSSNAEAIKTNTYSIRTNEKAIAANTKAIGQKVSQEQLTEAVQLAKEGTVSYQNAQALTQEQKQQARQNIGSADGEATEESLGAVRKWIFDSLEVEFVFGHLSATSDVESNYNKNICFKEKIFSRKGARFYVDEGYKYQISRYKVEDKTAIERVYWMQSDFVYVLEEDCYIRVEISDVNETVQTDLSISEHLHCEMFSDALNVKLAKIRDETQNLNRVEIDNFTARAIISIGNYSIGETVNMEPEALSYMKVAIVECTEGDQFLICAKGGVGPRVYGFVDGDNRLLSLAEVGTAEKDIKRTVTAPENAAKLVINTQDMNAKSYRLDIMGKNMKDIEQLRKQMSEKEALEAEQRDDTLKQTSNLVNALGLDAFRGKTMELCAPNQYTAWPFVCDVDGKLVCVYSRGLSHEDNVNPSIFSRVSHNGVIWSAERQIINTAGTRDTITGKGKDENGSMIFWDRKGGPGGGTSVHHLYRTTDGYHFEQVSAPSFSTVPAHIGDIIHVPEHGLMCFFNTAGSPMTWGVLKSQDNGLTWTQEAIEADIEGGDCPVEMSPVYLGEGKILVIGRQDKNDNGMFQIQSSDYGETWSKTVTNITGVRYITPSLVYDEAGSALNLYYYDRGTGILKKRTADASSVWGAPTSWPDTVNIATGYGKSQDAGNVNACTFGAIQFAAFYSGNETDTGIYGTII